MGHAGPASFRKYDDVRRWGLVEQRYPAGLEAESAEWLVAIGATRRPGAPEGAAAGAGHPVYLVVPYKISMPVE